MCAAQRQADLSIEGRRLAALVHWHLRTHSGPMLDSHVMLAVSLLPPKVAHCPVGRAMEKWGQHGGGGVIQAVLGAEGPARGREARC